MQDKKIFTSDFRVHSRRGFAMLTGALRVMPDFILIGAQRAGTTSLYNYLVQHPDVYPAFDKEVHFFDHFFSRGLNWYRSFFPFWMQKYYVETLRRRRFITGESTPYYLFHPHAAQRIAQVLPQVKLIVLLRNPVDRAYSHYHHEVRLGTETLSFEEALKREESLLPAAVEMLHTDPERYNFTHHHYAYLARGIYVDQLQRWANFFSQQQILALCSEDLYRQPMETMEKVSAFLGLSTFTLAGYKQYNNIKYQTMLPETRARLVAYFAPHNQKLYDYLNKNFFWDARGAG